MQDAAGLVLLPRRLELPATHASAAVLTQLAHAAGGSRAVPHAAGAVLDAADWVAVLVDMASGAVAALPLLTVLHDACTDWWFVVSPKRVFVLVCARSCSRCGSPVVKQVTVDAAIYRQQKCRTAKGLGSGRATAGVYVGMHEWIGRPVREQHVHVRRRDVCSRWCRASVARPATSRFFSKVGYADFTGAHPLFNAGGRSG